MPRLLSEIDDPFYRSLFITLHEKLALRREELENGVAQDQYREHVGYIRALKDILEMADEVYRDQYGPRPEEKNRSING